MKDPYLAEYDAYLNNLDRFWARERELQDLMMKKNGLQVPWRAFAVVTAVFAAVAFLPWLV